MAIGMSSDQSLSADVTKAWRSCLYFVGQAVTPTGHGPDDFRTDRSTARTSRRGVRPRQVRPAPSAGDGGPGEDFERYPRDERRDAELAAEAGVDLIWAPPVEEVYPEGFSAEIEVGGLASVLCGDPARRGPEHFRGVATVVAKLFNAVQPDVAYFGRKDAQQVAVIRRMVRDLDFSVRIEALPIVREPDGLAMSSRNAYLSAEDRERASALSRALRSVEAEARAGSLAAGLEAGRRELAAAGIEPEYLEARDPDDLTAVNELNGAPVLVAVAARVGDARLIDNVLITDTEART